MRVTPVGPSAVLVEVSSTDEAIALYTVAREVGVDAREVVPGARTVLFDGTGPDFQVPSGFEARKLPPQPADVVEIPTTYDGPDLASTAELLGMTTSELVARHSGVEHRVAFCGFAPGFAYCTGLGLEVPRLPSPRPKVAPGSVGLAGEFTGIYPTASPGGWRLIGRTDVSLWDAAAEQPALLTPGTTVRFRPS